MRLTLKVKAYCDQPPVDEHARSFDTFPVILGRSTACDYCLNDASRYISSNHAVVIQDGGQLLIQDTSANGVYLNGASEPVGRGRSQALSQADTLAIGDYILQVSVDSHAQAATANQAADPFDDFANTAAAEEKPAAVYDPFRGDEPDWTPPSKTTDDPFGSDWDLNEVPSDAPQPGPGPGHDNPGQSWADWDNEQPAQGARRPAVSPRQQPDPFALENDEYDWLPGTSSETVSLPPAFPDPQAPPPRQRRPESAARQHATPRPGNPSAVHERPESARYAQPAPSNHRSQTGHQHPLDALIHGASLRESDFSSRDETELLEQTGRLLAQMVDAMMVLLQSRAQFKNAMRTDVTTLSRSDNNPLKFSYSSADALTRLLADNSDGYQAADSAVQEAVDDLKLHQVAMLEGMKAAVRSLLLQFDPGKLSKKLEKTGGISANIPITREAKLWEMFCQQYDAIREEAVNDFGEMFGAEFRKAYEKRIKQMGRRPEF